MVDFDKIFKDFCDAVDALPEMGYLIASDDNDEIESIVSELKKLNKRQE